MAQKEVYRNNFTDISAEPTESNQVTEAEPNSKQGSGGLSNLMLKLVIVLLAISILLSLSVLILVILTYVTKIEQAEIRQIQDRIVTNEATLRQLDQAIQEQELRLDSLLKEVEDVQQSFQNQENKMDSTLRQLQVLTPHSQTAVRLVGGNGVTSGRVEVLYLGEWATICDDLWDIEDATVVCRMLGYNATSALPNAHFGEGTGLIALDEMECRGTEVSIWDCPGNSWGYNNCGHGEDASVVCE